MGKQLGVAVYVMMGVQMGRQAADKLLKSIELPVKLGAAVFSDIRATNIFSWFAGKIDVQTDTQVGQRPAQGYGCFGGRHVDHQARAGQNSAAMRFNTASIDSLPGSDAIPIEDEIL